MDKMTKQIESKLVEVTERAKRLIYDYGKYGLAETLQMTNKTLDNRLEKNNWTYAEKLTIDLLTQKTLN